MKIKIKENAILITVQVICFQYLNFYAFKSNLHEESALGRGLSSFKEDRLHTSNDLTNYLQRLKNEYILNTPFYIYEELAFENATILYNNSRYTYEELIKHSFVNLKHSEDFWFYKSAMHHKMRVMDPSKAKLFYVPPMMNMIALGTLNGKFKYCINKWMCNERIYIKIHRFLRGSKYFKRNEGKDHIIVASHFGYNTKWLSSYGGNQLSTAFVHRITKTYSSIFKCNKIGFENVNQPAIINKDRINFPSTYFSQPCQKESSPQRKSLQFIFVANMKKKMFSQRRNICSWLNDTQLGHLSSLCGSGIPLCKHIQKAKYGFHVQGDTFGSSRPIDLIMNGVIPIFTQERQYDILPDWIPWRNISFFADVSSKDAFVDSIKKISSDKSMYEIKRQAILEYQELFDLRKTAPFDMYMYMFASRIFSAS